MCPWSVRCWSHLVWQEALAKEWQKRNLGQALVAHELEKVSDEISEMIAANREKMLNRDRVQRARKAKCEAIQDSEPSMPHETQPREPQVEAKVEPNVKVESKVEVGPPQEFRVLINWHRLPTTPSFSHPAKHQLNICGR